MQTFCADSLANPFQKSISKDNAGLLATLGDVT